MTKHSFEKTLRWLPGAAGQHLFSADGASKTQAGQADGKNPPTVPWPP
ncbi:MAG: hypothetical protein ABSA53_01445 [Streptosporangiaceae bacterium]